MKNWQSLALFLNAVPDAPGISKGTKSSHFLGLLMQFGGLGIFALAIVDSSAIPIFLPGSTDLVLLLLCAFRSSSVTSPVVFASCALAGSIIGGYMTWAAGKKGGEAALKKLKGRFVRRIQQWVKKNGMLSVWFAAIHPPPIPLMPFLLGAGALGLSRPRFLISYCLGRAMRYGAIAWLGYHYGRYMIALWQKYLSKWTIPILSVYVSLIVLGVGYGIWKYRKETHKNT